MSRFIPTVPQWPCRDCRKLITRHRAYCWVQYGLEGGTQVFGIQRTVHGAYCLACARAEAARQEAT